MNRLLTARDIAERYQKSEKTAKRYMRQMEHMEKPLRVTEQAVEAWETSKTYAPQRERERIRQTRPVIPDLSQRFIIPRVRPGRTEKVR